MIYFSLVNKAGYHSVVNKARYHSVVNKAGYHGFVHFCNIHGGTLGVTGRVVRINDTMIQWQEEEKHCQNPPAVRPVGRGGVSSCWRRRGGGSHGSNRST